MSYHTDIHVVSETLSSKLNIKCNQGCTLHKKYRNIFSLLSNDIYMAMQIYEMYMSQHLLKIKQAIKFVPQYVTCVFLSAGMLQSWSAASAWMTGSLWFWTALAGRVSRSSATVDLQHKHTVQSPINLVCLLLIWPMMPWASSVIILGHDKANKSKWSKLQFLLFVYNCY